MNRNELIQTVREMVSASSCCQELKKAGQDYLDSSAEGRKAAAEKLVQELREDVATIDEALEFLRSPVALEMFGPEVCQAQIKHAEEVKKSGGKWCSCPACAAGAVLLEHADML